MLSDVDQYSGQLFSQGHKSPMHLNLLMKFFCASVNGCDECVFVCDFNWL